MAKKIKLFDPLIGREEQISLIKVLKSRFWASGSGVGNVYKFEKKFKEYVNSDECIAVNSGTAALNLALSLIDIKNKEVILPSLSFVSTAHAVVLNGGIPVFVDIDPHTLCLDPEKIKKSITKRSKVILPVHFGGMPCNLNEIKSICEEHKLTLIEDAAHASGADYNNKKIGTHGLAVCFSFHPVKNLAMPTGGLISINHHSHKELKKKLFARRWCGISNRENSHYDVKEIGWNYYMNEFSAALGLIQLQKLDKMNEIRKRNAYRFTKEILLETKMPFNNDCVYHFYWLMVKNRKELRRKLQKNGIETGTHYSPIHKFRMYKSNKKLQMTEKAGNTIVTIPTHPNLTETDVEKIIHLINKYS